MNECRSLHETAMGNLMSKLAGIAADEAERAAKEKKRGKKINTFASTSLARMTSNLVLVFPVMVSKTVSIDTAMTIAKAIELRGAQMVQMVFAANQVTDQNIDDLFSYLRRFHSNINFGDPLRFSVDDFMKAVNAFTEADVSPTDQIELNAIKEDMKNISFYFEEDYSPSSLSAYSIKSTPSGIKVESAADSTLDDDQYKAAKLALDREKNEREKDKFKYQKMNDMLERLQTPSFLDTDVKKANDALPTLMKVNFIVKNPGGEPIKVEGGVVGVKARIVPIDSNDITTHLLTKAKDSNVVLNFIRATTREISFAKDFLFGINQAKIDAMAVSKKSSSPLWKILERRAILSKKRRYSNSVNSFMAISTLVVSQDEIDYIKANSNGMYDFEDYKLASKLLDTYNFICFTVVDENLEIVKMLYDTGENAWDNYPLRALKRENDNSDYKKIINLMTKVAK